MGGPCGLGRSGTRNCTRIGANSSCPTEAQQALYGLPQTDYHVISSGTTGYEANPGYNLVTGLGTPVANLLVSDLVAYAGPGTTYSGATVGPLQDATRLDGGSGGGGTMNAIRVFDALAAADHGIEAPRVSGDSSDSRSPMNELLAANSPVHSIAIDRARKVQPARVAPNLTRTETFAGPLMLRVTNLMVETGSIEPSYVRYLDIGFRESNSQPGGALTQIARAIGSISPEIQLYKYDLNDEASSKTAVSHSGVSVSVIDRAIELDFGANGLGGSPNTTSADGYYELDNKLPNGTIAVHHFYRLLSDVTGDGIVDDNDLNEIAAEINLSSPPRMAPLGADVNGYGSVSALELTLATRAKGHKLKSRLSLG